MPTEVTLVLEQIFFIHKQPLQEGRVYSCLVPTPLLSQQEPDSTALEAAGFVKFQNPEGSYSWVNVKQAIFTMSPELGIYVFVFPGGSKVGVKATGEEVNAALNATETTKTGNIIQ